jgi:hypothetical protein
LTVDKLNASKEASRTGKRAAPEQYSTQGARQGPCTMCEGKVAGRLAEEFIHWELREDE